MSCVRECARCPPLDASNGWGVVNKWKKRVSVKEFITWPAYCTTPRYSGSLRASGARVLLPSAEILTSIDHLIHEKTLEQRQPDTEHLIHAETTSSTRRPIRIFIEAS